MSLVPMLFSDWWEDLENPHSIFDQHFGLGLLPSDLPQLHWDGPRAPALRRRGRNQMYYNSPWRNNRGPNKTGMSTVKNEKDKFEVTLDVSQFKPEEITVKTLGKFITVEGKHAEQKDEHGSISRQFTRRYTVPERCNIDQIASSLSSDGILNITVPKKPIDKSKEKVIAIEKTGKPAIQNNNKKPDQCQKK